MIFKTLLNGTYRGEVECNNITQAQDATISLLVNEGDYIDIQHDDQRAYRTRKLDNAHHWAHPGHTFNVHPKGYTI